MYGGYRYQDRLVAGGWVPPVPDPDTAHTVCLDCGRDHPCIDHGPTRVIDVDPLVRQGQHFSAAGVAFAVMAVLLLVVAGLLVWLALP